MVDLLRLAFPVNGEFLRVKSTTKDCNFNLSAIDLAAWRYLIRIKPTLVHFKNQRDIFTVGRDRSFVVWVEFMNFYNGATRIKVGKIQRDGGISHPEGPLSGFLKYKEHAVISFERGSVHQATGLF